MYEPLQAHEDRAEMIEIEVVVPELTDAGREWAEENVESSQIARVALLSHAGATDWPAVFRRTAVALANRSGVERAAGVGRTDGYGGELMEGGY